MLSTAVEIGVFDYLAENGPSEIAKIGEDLKLNPKMVGDFLKSLAAMKILSRDENDLFSNTPES